MAQGRDFTGERFGRLTAICYTGKNTKQGRNAIWLFRCDCGNYVERVAIGQKYSKVPSCGCYLKERAGALNRTHGGRHERLYYVWMDMRRRCYDPKDTNYKRYGERGVRVCEEWNDYAKFREWANASGYDKNAKKQHCTIDRIDNNGNYCPENCRWVDSKTQSNNRSTNKIVEYQGRRQTLKQWTDELGLKYALVQKRLMSGWTAERAFNEPSRFEKLSIRKETC